MHFMEDVFGAPYCDQFGCAEIDRSAWQCLERGGYHMDCDSVVTEFLDKNGEAVSAGERGEVTYTSLFNYAMPLIRYSIGDIGVLSADACSCGVNLPLMGVVEGRKDSFLLLPDNRIVSPMVFNFAVSQFRYYSDIDQYQIRQRKIDLFEVNLKLAKSPTKQDFVREEFVRHVRRFLDLSDSDIEFDVSLVDEIPLSKTGKLMSVWSDLKPTL
jgi:phenylacetate-CoA ligase